MSWPYSIAPTGETHGSGIGTGHCGAAPGVNPNGAGDSGTMNATSDLGTIESRPAVHRPRITRQLDVRASRHVGVALFRRHWLYLTAWWLLLWAGTEVLAVWAAWSLPADYYDFGRPADNLFGLLTPFWLVLAVRRIMPGTFRLSFGRVTRLFVYNFAYGLAVFVGLLLLIVPGFYVAARGIFGFAAISEGHDLGQAFHVSAAATRESAWKLTWFLLVATVAAFVIAMLVLGATYIALVVGGHASLDSNAVSRTEIVSFAIATTLLAAPIVAAFTAWYAAAWAQVTAPSPAQPEPGDLELSRAPA